MSLDPDVLARAVRAVRDADALLVGAGAGIGVDSGLPDFRGDRGFWNAYPPFERLGLSFVDLADPHWFESDPTLAWGFYGHRLNLYRATRPHDGFAVLRRWAERMPGGGFVFTSNVDGQFQAAGWPDGQLVECHGSIHHLQCTRRCRAIWDGSGAAVDVDASTMRARGDLPRCDCGALARPNILMFGDGGWQSERTREQHARFERWLSAVRGRRLVVVECGAGTAVPSVRRTCEQVAARTRGTLVRINPREPHGPSGICALAAGALEALARIDGRMATST